MILYWTVYDQGEPSQGSPPVASDLKSGLMRPVKDWDYRSKKVLAVKMFLVVGQDLSN